MQALSPTERQPAPHPPESISSKLVLASGCRSRDLGVKMMSWKEAAQPAMDPGTRWRGRPLRASDLVLCLQLRGQEGPG